MILDQSCLGSVPKKKRNGRVRAIKKAQQTIVSSPPHGINIK